APYRFGRRGRDRYPRGRPVAELVQRLLQRGLLLGHLVGLRLGRVHRLVQGGLLLAGRGQQRGVLVQLPVFGAAELAQPVGPPQHVVGGGGVEHRGKRGGRAGLVDRGDEDADLAGQLVEPGGALGQLRPELRLLGLRRGELGLRVLVRLDGGGHLVLDGGIAVRIRVRVGEARRGQYQRRRGERGQQPAEPSHICAVLPRGRWAGASLPGTARGAYR